MTRTHAGPARARRGAAGGVPAPRAPRRGGRRHVVRAGHRRRAQQPHVPGRRRPAAARGPAAAARARADHRARHGPRAPGHLGAAGVARAGARRTVALVDDPTAGTGGVFYVMDLVEGTVLAHPSQNTDLHRRRAARREPRAGHAAGRAARDRARRRRARGPGPGRRVPRPSAAPLADPARRLALAAGAEPRRPAGTPRRARPDHPAQQHRARRLPPGQRAGRHVDRQRPAHHRHPRLGDGDARRLGRRPGDARPLLAHPPDIEGGGSVAPSAVDPAAGYPEFDELVDAYSARLGSSVPELGWYRAFAAYKLAVILEGIHFRFLGGDTVGEGFDRIGALVAPLADEGLAQLAGVVR